MKIGIALLLTFFVFFQKGNAKNYYQPKSDSVVYYLDLPDSAQFKWYSMDDVWHKKYYLNLLKENKLKLSCAGCENIYIDVIVEIDKNGKLISHKLVDGNQCGGKPTKKLVSSFIKYWYTYLFPPELRGLKIQIRLGTGLKC